MKPIGDAAVAAWNWAFREAGIAMRLDVDHSKTVEAGDIRYVYMNFVENLKPSGIGGYGPSLTNPNNGEIITASANVFLHSYTNSAKAAVRWYIRVNSGVLEDHQAFLKGLPGMEYLPPSTLDLQAKYITPLHYRKEREFWLIDKYCPEVVKYADRIRQNQIGFLPEFEQALANPVTKI